MPLNTDSSTPQAFRPTLAWVFQSPARAIAFGLGSGAIRPAPGTWGSIAGWLVWVFGLGRLPDAAMVVLLVAAFVLGCWACAVVGRELGVPDHGGMVWDEVVAIWLVLWLTPPSLPWQLFALILFRVFDILKPPPVRYFDQRFKNGFGVMVDDLVAAAYALLVLAVALRFIGMPT